jgi:hypothetical protein
MPKPKIKWAIVTETKYVTKGTGLAWTYDRAEAESCAKSIPGAWVVNAEEFQEQFNQNILAAKPARRFDSLREGQSNNGN